MVIEQDESALTCSIVDLLGRKEAIYCSNHGANCTAEVAELLRQAYALSHCDAFINLFPSSVSRVRSGRHRAWSAPVFSGDQICYQSRPSGNRHRAGGRPMVDGTADHSPVLSSTPAMSTYGDLYQTPRLRSANFRRAQGDAAEHVFRALYSFVSQGLVNRIVDLGCGNGAHS